MSLKPQKKSDSDKGWMKKRQDRAIKLQPEYHLIVTEGEKTEPQYFGSIRDSINRRHRNRIQLDIYGEGRDTLRLLDKAVERVRKSPTVYKHVWVVYDTDDFPAERVNKTAELCNSHSSEETTYHAIWSNQCIELWYLLHFSYFHSDISRESYWPKLTDWLESIGYGKYTKNREDMYLILKPYMDTAIANAKRLEAENAGKSPSAARPGTRIHVLIEKLRPYLREEQ